MTALKAHEVERFLAKPDLDRGVFLAYGPDQGLVSETARRLMRHYAGADADPMSEIILEPEELKADPSRLAVEARMISMFGGLTRIRVRGANKTLTKTLTELLEDMPETVIVLEAGNLPPRDSLRALAESKKNARTLPCYADNAETLKSLIRKTFSDAEISVDSNTIALLSDTLGNDREVTRRELEKLTLYAADSKTLTTEDIETLSGDNATITIDEILDSTGTGRTEKLDQAITRAFNAGVDAQRLLISALNHFTWLRRLRADVDSGAQPREVLDRQRPRPHFSRKSNLEQQLRLWSDETLASACSRIYQAISISRKSAPLASAITHRTLLAICTAAARR